MASLLSAFVSLVALAQSINQGLPLVFDLIQVDLEVVGENLFDRLADTYKTMIGAAERAALTVLGDC